MKILKNYVSTIAKSVVVIFTVAGVVSCQKNKNDDPVAPEGYWKGHYTVIGYDHQLQLRVLVKPGGTARVYDMGIKTDTAAVAAIDKYNATWVLSNNLLDVMFYSDKITLFRGTIDPGAKTWTGTWMRDADVKGTMSLVK